MNGLNDNVDRKFLHQLCEKFGNIEGIKIFYDPLTKRHLGKARVGFTTSASAKLAVAKLDATSIMGCIVHADLEHKGTKFVSKVVGERRSLITSVWWLFSLDHLSPPGHVDFVDVQLLKQHVFFFSQLSIFQLLLAFFRSN